MEILRQLRKQKNCTQTDVAKYLGITVSAYGNYELGQRQPNPEMLQKLADFFGVSVDYLLGRETSKVQDPQKVLKDMYFHLGKEAQEMGLQKEDIEMLLDFARIHQERNKKK